MSAFHTRPALATIRVTGDDRLGYLDDVTSQQLRAVAPGEARGALHLDPHGSVLAVMDVAVREDDLLLLVPEELAGHVLEVLGGRTFLLDATFEASDERVVAVRGVEPPGRVGLLGGLPEPGQLAGRGESLLIGREGGVDVVAPPAALDGVIDELEADGVVEGDDDALEDWRIRAGIPRWGSEIVSGHLPEELGLLPTHVHLGKGCYPGQEAVARMWMLGRPRRRLAVVEVDGEVTPGWETGEGRQRIQVTSVTSDGEVALAFVPGDTESGTQHRGEDAAITIRRVLGDTLDVPGHDPKVTRRRDRSRTGAGSRP